MDAQTAKTSDLGFYFGEQVPRPGKVAACPPNFFKDDNTTHANTPYPRFPASSRRAGVFFDDAQNFFVWQFPRMARNFHGRIRVERGIQ